MIGAYLVFFFLIMYKHIDVQQSRNSHDNGVRNDKNDDNGNKGRYQFETKQVTD